MTQLGKILVFATVALSFMMLAWALALYMNRIDWTTNPAKGEQPAGALVARKKRIEEATAALDVSAIRWREALRGNDGKDGRPVRDGLLTWEKRRIDDRAWYDTQLKAVRSGPDGKGSQVVVQRVATTKEGLPILDPAIGNRPKLENAERRKKDEKDPKADLYCYDYYDRRMGELRDETIATDKSFQASLDKAAEMLKELVGPRGVQQRIVDEKEKLRLIDQELKDVDDRKTNGEVETELLLARNGQLQRRVQELQKARTEVKD